MATIILGVSGSIAAYKAADLASRLKKRGHQVTCILTESAQKLVTPHTFMNLTGQRVFTDLFDDANGQTEHIAVTDRAELVVVAPATANTIAKMAVGLADDMLSTTLLAVNCPVLVCPAMNTRMWAHPTVKRNLAALRSEGVHILEPDAGLLACGHVGPGRLAEPEHIEREVEKLLAVRASSSSPESRPRTFVERITLSDEPSADLLAAESAFRAKLAASGVVVGSGPVGPGAREMLYVSRAASLEEARKRAEDSPLVRGGARLDLAEWRLEAGELFPPPVERLTRTHERRHDPEAPTVAWRNS